MDLTLLVTRGDDDDCVDWTVELLSPLADDSELQIGGVSARAHSLGLACELGVLRTFWVEGVAERH